MEQESSTVIATTPPESRSEKHIEDQSGSGKVNGVTPATPSLPDVPDGGWRACLIVFGSSLTLFASFGVVSRLDDLVEV